MWIACLIRKTQWAAYYKCCHSVKLCVITAELQLLFCSVLNIRVTRMITWWSATNVLKTSRAYFTAEVEWQLFTATIASSVAQVCGLKRLGTWWIIAKKTWNQEVKDPIQAKKIIHSRSWLDCKPSFIESLQTRIPLKKRISNVVFLSG